MIDIAVTACEIKGLFGSIGRPPTNQSALLDNFKSEAKHCPGYFFAPKRTVPQIYLLTVLNSQGTLDGAYFKERTQDLDRKLLNAQKQLHADLNDKDSERLAELRKLIGIFERAEPITDFDEIKFGQIVEKITVLSETEIRFELIGGIGFTERIAR